ncbi:MAG: hypothetical protein K2Q25_12005 [Mycobacteriaceae bacterium]|nr:hypothetical protein [Mycobacteriaceae bacterium]
MIIFMCGSWVKKLAQQALYRPGLAAIDVVAIERAGGYPQRDGRPLLAAAAVGTGVQP